MAELIANGTTETTSADFTMANGDSATIYLKNAAGPLLSSDARAVIQIKSADGNYFTIGEINRANPAKVLSAPGTFRVVKIASANAYGVDKT